MITGRPTVMTPETISKLEEIYALGGSDGEACLFAGIGKSTLYKYQEEHPEFIERKEELQETPVLKARRTIDKSLDVAQNAQWYLERKKKREFSSRTELTGENGKELYPSKGANEKATLAVDQYLNATERDTD